MQEAFMLVISRHASSRHAEQQILIPHAGIMDSILQVRGRLVKLRIDAPVAVEVFRQEPGFFIPLKRLSA
jgi:sRNA-binding carbon storage regulator CsrA